MMKLGWRKAIKYWVDWWGFCLASQVIPVITNVKYGYLYNPYVITDSRNIANTGWHVPSPSDFDTLFDYLGGFDVAGGALKETGLSFWESPNSEASNLSLFNFRGSGYRHGNGSFRDLYNTGHLRYDSLTIISLSFENGNVYLFSGILGSSSSVPIRLIKDSTTLLNGQTGSYTGNDGKVYRTICIGTQEWLADNLAETKYRNGDDIPTITDKSEWVALTTGAKCAYNNDESNVLN